MILPVNLLKLLTGDAKVGYDKWLEFVKVRIAASRPGGIQRLGPEEAWKVVEGILATPTASAPAPLTELRRVGKVIIEQIDNPGNFTILLRTLHATNLHINMFLSLDDSILLERKQHNGIQCVVPVGHLQMLREESFDKKDEHTIRLLDTMLPGLQEWDHEANIHSTYVMAWALPFRWDQWKEQGTDAVESFMVKTGIEDIDGAPEAPRVEDAATGEMSAKGKKRRLSPASQRALGSRMLYLQGIEYDG